LAVRETLLQPQATVKIWGKPRALQQKNKSNARTAATKKQVKKRKSKFQYHFMFNKKLENNTVRGTLDGRMLALFVLFMFVFAFILTIQFGFVYNIF